MKIKKSYFANIALILTLSLFISIPGYLQEKVDLAEFLDRVALGITRTEAIKKFQEVNPIPKKLTTNVYGAKINIVDDFWLLGMFSFCNNKLALLQDFFISRNKEQIKDAFNAMETEMGKDVGLSKKSCKTTEFCIWDFPLIDYSETLIITSDEEGDVHVLVLSRRINSLITEPTCKQIVQNELGKAQDKLGINKIFK